MNSPTDLELAAAMFLVIALGFALGAMIAEIKDARIRYKELQSKLTSLSARVNSARASKSL